MPPVSTSDEAAGVDDVGDNERIVDIKDIEGRRLT
jgi:hypothetical protein